MTPGLFLEYLCHEADFMRLQVLRACVDDPTREAGISWMSPPLDRSEVRVVKDVMTVRLYPCRVRFVEEPYPGALVTRTLKVAALAWWEDVETWVSSGERRRTGRQELRPRRPPLIRLQRLPVQQEPVVMREQESLPSAADLAHAMAVEVDRQLMAELRATMATKRVRVSQTRDGRIIGHPDPPGPNLIPPEHAGHEADARAYAYADMEALSRAAEQLAGIRTAQREPPTTACAWCPKVFPAADAYRSTTDEALICPECFESARTGGRARLVEGAPTEERTYGNILEKRGS
jgi:hypothetical protein